MKFSIQSLVGKKRLNETTLPMRIEVVDPSDFILTASEDRKLKFWDLRRTYEPVNVIKRYLSTEVSWQLHWCGISVAQENCYVTFGLNGIHYIDAGYIGYKPYFVAPRRGTVWSISGSDWLNTCTTGDSTGEVIMMLLADMTANPNNIRRSSDRRFQYAIYIVPVHKEVVNPVYLKSSDLFK
ncbi:UNVERIFIED_CONTAM: hypothetical protein FKN15_018387 [Acipenser sinensis]